MSFEGPESFAPLRITTSEGSSVLSCLCQSNEGTLGRTTLFLGAPAPTGVTVNRFRGLSLLLAPLTALSTSMRTHVLVAAGVPHQAPGSCSSPCSTWLQHCSQISQLEASSQSASLHPTWPSPGTSKTSHVKQPWSDMSSHFSSQETPLRPNRPVDKGLVLPALSGTLSLAVADISTRLPPAGQPALTCRACNCEPQSQTRSIHTARQLPLPRA